jgi:hypothetical protein
MECAAAAVAAVETATPTPAAPVVRIDKITLTDFRGFPGPAPASFNLGGKNLLVYGENGAGKSSLFYALVEFFSLKPTRPLSTYKNVFSGQAEADCKVSIEFVGDAKLVDWTVGAHPCVFDFTTPVDDWYKYMFGDSDTRTIDAALRAACLDYKSLLNTNFRHGEGAINLFAIAVEHLLRDYPVPRAGITTTLGALWAEVQAAMPASGKASAIEKIIQACINFNTAYQPALLVLLPQINALLHALGWHEVVLTGLQSPGLTYQPAKLKRDRVLNGQVLEPKLTFRNQPLERPQTFLNEARLSALGLALYLAGRLASTPTAPSSALKLLVLDDVLIGLDHSNRLPVLEVLADLFSDWQIVLMTHDRGWFDLARQRLPDGDWACYEIYEGDQAAAAPMPVVRKTAKRPAPALLQKARELLNQGYIEAAANYVRQAFETGIRAACELKSVKLAYKQDITSHQAQDLLNGLKVWPGTATVLKADWDAALSRLELLKDVVMNPYSHPSAPNIPRQEVVDAADAVERFLDLVRTK